MATEKEINFLFMESDMPWYSKIQMQRKINNFINLSYEVPLRQTNIYLAQNKMLYFENKFKYMKVSKKGNNNYSLNFMGLFIMQN